MVQHTIEAPANAVVGVAVLSDDLLTGQGAVAVLRSRTDLRIVPHDRRHEADVMLLLVSHITDATLAWLRSEASAAAGRTPRFVLVGDGVREHHVLGAITHGLVSVIPRQEADYNRISRALLNAQRNLPDLPLEALGWLVKQLREVELTVLAPHGLTSTGLESRELEVLKLLADGWETGEIAARLNFSERTVKNIVHRLLSRHDLRNRTHAVSFALRNNLL